MKKPVPYTETKQIMNFIDMQRWIDEKYGITARDYAGKYKNPRSWVSIVIDNGIAPERAEELYSASPLAVKDEAEKAAMEAASKAIRDWLDSVPYQDFWHFQLNLFHNFYNDSYQTFPLLYQMEACEEDWQREIAQLWLDEYEEFVDEEGCIVVWVSW